jgi:hypothetical protein
MNQILIFSLKNHKLEFLHVIGTSADFKTNPIWDIQFDEEDHLVAVGNPAYSVFVFEKGMFVQRNNDVSAAIEAQHKLTGKYSQDDLSMESERRKDKNLLEKGKRLKNDE